jgi:hypothetical protein
VCREAAISRTLCYRWKRRYLRYGEAGLLPRPARPRRWGRQSSPALEHAVLAYALHWPTHGPARLADQLRRQRILRALSKKRLQLSRARPASKKRRHPRLRG